jgi:electron transfer flavoprotein alpha subunit
MSSILVFAEHVDGKLKKSALELLTAARKSGLKVQALLTGPGAKGALGQLGEQGAHEAFFADGQAFACYNPELFAQVVSEVIDRQKPKAVLASSTSLARDLFPRVAARLKAPAISDCTELSFTGGEILVRRPLYAGKCTAQVEFCGEGPRIALMRPNQLPAEPASAKVATTAHDLASPSASLRTIVQDVVKGASEKLDLTEANVIVAGGRGMKEAANFKLLDELAEVLGATVGASRAVVDAGWVPHSMQVGQTGKTVAPTLYIAAGISGAIQHLAGMSGAKVVVAINKDANAPIFQKATYGIVGDAIEILPMLAQEFKKLLRH